VGGRLPPHRHSLEALAELGYEVDLLTLPIGKPPHANGVRPLFVPRVPFCRSLPDGPSVRRFALDTLMLFKAVFLAGRTPYALIHGIDDCGVIAWLAGRLTKTPAVFERHTFAEPGRVKGPRRLWLGFYRVLERRALKKRPPSSATAPRWSTCSPASAAAAAPASSPTSRSHRRGLLPARNLALARYKTSAGQKLVTCVGSHTRFEGLDLFIDAIPDVLRELPDTRFVVVGGDAAEISRMRAELAQKGAEQAVAFPGRIPPGELAALLSVSDVLVSPRRAGSTAPIKVLDYLRSGAPIVAVDAPANRAVLSPENALLTRPDPAALAAGILRICQSPRLGDELGSRGKEALQRENHTPEAFRTALHRCYEYVLATP
jgi:glycosyltransferase involved in cell wall biosynthesis